MSYKITHVTRNMIKPTQKLTLSGHYFYDASEEAHPLKPSLAMKLHSIIFTYTSFEKY